MSNVKFAAAVGFVVGAALSGATVPNAISSRLVKTSCLVFPSAQAEAAPLPEPPRRAEFPRPATPPEVQRALQAYNRWAAGIRTVKGGGRAHVGAEGQETRAFDFSMVLARPASARIQGRWGSLASLFDLSGNPDGWTLYLPRDRAVVKTKQGDASAGLLLPPAEIVSVLLPEGIPPRDVTVRGAVAWESESTLRVVVPPGRGGAGSEFHRVLWLNAEAGRPLRLEIRKRSQLEPMILAADYEDYEGEGAKAFPVKVRVELPEDGQWARFSFSTLRINTSVADRLFAIRVPAGTRSLPPEDLSPDFLPVAEEEPGGTK